MVETEKKRFAAVLRATMLTLGSPAPEIEVLRIWWAALNRIELADVEKAFGEYVTHGKRAPKPADILEIIEKMRPDGRPTADEAWAAIPRDENISVVWSSEMSEAFGVAKPLLDCGDQVAARMAFRDAYNTAVDRNKRAGIAPKWSPSFGHDVQGRAVAIADAVNKGRLSFDSAVNLLPDAIEEIAKITRKPLPMLEDFEGKSKIRALVNGLNEELKAKLKNAT